MIYFVGDELYVDKNGASINQAQAISGHSDKSVDVLLRYIRTTPEKALDVQPD